MDQTSDTHTNPPPDFDHFSMADHTSSRLHEVHASPGCRFGLEPSPQAVLNTEVYSTARLLSAEGSLNLGLSLSNSGQVGPNHPQQPPPSFTWPINREGFSSHVGPRTQPYLQQWLMRTCKENKGLEQFFNLSVWPSGPSVLSCCYGILSLSPPEY